MSDFSSGDGVQTWTDMPGVSEKFAVPQRPLALSSRTTSANVQATTTAQVFICYLSCLCILVQGW